MVVRRIGGVRANVQLCHAIQHSVGIGDVERVDGHVKADVVPDREILGQPEVEIRDIGQPASSKSRDQEVFVSFLARSLKRM